MAMATAERFTVGAFHEQIASHPVVAPLAAKLVFGLYRGAGELAGTFIGTGVDEAPLPGAGAEVRVGVLHPVELDEARRAELARAIGPQPFPQLEREVYDAGAARRLDVRGWPIPHRRIQSLVAAGGWQERRTRCYAGLHDPNFLDRFLPSGLTLRVGFSPGKHPGDAILGGIGLFDARTQKAASLDLLTPVQASELVRDVELLQGPRER